MNLRRLASLSLAGAFLALMVGGSSGCVVRSGPARAGHGAHRHCHYRPNARPGMRNLCHAHPHPAGHH